MKELNVCLARMALAACLLGASVPATAGQIDVVVTTQGKAGAVGCALFSKQAGFPMDRGGADVETMAVPSGGAFLCRFQVPDTAATYAVSAFLDENGNGRLDRNAFGLPKEPWGVSNNARPALRAPRFSEARFSVGAGQKKTVQLSVK